MVGNGFFSLPGAGGNRRHGADRARQVAFLSRFVANAVPWMRMAPAGLPS